MPKPSTVETESDDDSLDDDNNNRGQGTEMMGQVEETGDEKGDESVNGTTLDELFTEMFVEEVRQYTNLDELSADIDAYEQKSGFRLIIRKSEPSARTYICGSHVGCCFRARFGRVRLKETIGLKTTAHGSITNPYHCGDLAPPTAADGRARKRRRLKGRVDADSVPNASTDDPTRPGVVCSRCSMKGHNIRTCLKREAKRAKEDTLLQSGEMEQQSGETEQLSGETEPEETQAEEA